MTNKTEIVSVPELSDGDIVSCHAGTFKVSNRRVCFGHRMIYSKDVRDEEIEAILSAPETSDDVIAFDGEAIDPGQRFQTWTIQGNMWARVGRLTK